MTTSSRFPRVVGRYLTALLLVLTPLAFVLATSAPASASHSRATQLTWVKTGTDSARFTSVVSFRASYYGDPNTMQPGDQIYEPCISFGDGDEHCGAEIETIDAANDVLTARVSVEHTYTGTGPFTAEVNSCCRLSPPLHINNPDVDYRAVTVVDLDRTSGNPTSATSPIVDCAPDSLCRFTIPAVDTDAASLRFRMATSDEASGAPVFIQPGPPHATNAATIDAVTGEYVWDTRGATQNASGIDTFYSTQVVIEELDAQGQQITASPVDFFIRISGSSNQAPVFTSPTPADGSQLQASVGQPLTFDVAAMDPDGADVVTTSVLSKPPGASYASTPGNPATGTFSWTPTTPGKYIVLVTAADGHGLQATQRSITINVSSHRDVVMTGAASSLSADLTILGAPVVLLPPTPTTGSISTTESLTARPACGRSDLLTLLCSSVVTDKPTSTSSAEATVSQLRLGVPGGLPAIGKIPATQFPKIDLRALESTSTSSCAAGSAGTAEIAYLAVAGKVLIGGPTVVKPNTRFDLGWVTVIANEQIPTSDGLQVHGLHLIVQVPFLTRTDLYVASSRSGVSGC